MYRIKQLLASDQMVYHTGDLAVLWGMKNTNTLYTTIKRYVRQGILFPLHKGLYATVPLERLDPYTVGAAVLHQYCYVTMETALFQAGYINQPTQAITYVSPVSRTFSLAGFSFVSRQLSYRFLMQTSGVSEKNGVLWANPNRAVADMLYFNTHYYFDGQSAIDWKQVHEIQKEVGYI